MVLLTVAASGDDFLDHPREIDTVLLDMRGHLISAIGWSSSTPSRWKTTRRMGKSWN